MKEFLTINLELCTGCRNCEMACSVAHTNSFNPKRARIQILKDEVKNLIVPMVCLQCETPLCEEACPNGAIMKNKHGILYVNHDVCIGCANCVTACVYGGIAIDPRSKKAIKCDLCDGDPACVKACEYGAITVATMKKEGLRKRREAVSPALEKLRIQVEEAQ